MPLASQFVFVLCQRGAENALKQSLSRHASDTWSQLRPGYQRPGVVTFRAPAPHGPELQVDHPLARVSGLSLGLCDSLAELPARITDLPRPLRLHVIERDLYRPDEAPKDHRPGELATSIEVQLRALLPDAFHPQPSAAVGELVLDVIVAAGDPLLVGVHRHRRGRSPLPGGVYAYELPDSAPSRAYRKIEEAIAAFELPLRAGDRVLELGAAPGGASYALLRRGLSVIGVDPAEMDPHTLSFCGAGGAQLTHLMMPMAAVRREQLPPSIEWLLLDVHLAPQVALRATQRFSSMFRSSLLGVVLTLKLNDWDFLDRLPVFLETVRRMGVLNPEARQLPAHRQELAIAGVTERGARRR